MDEETFERLYAQAFQRDNALIHEASTLAQSQLAPFTIMQAFRLARDLLDAGAPFFQRCEKIYQERSEVLIRCAHREGRLQVVDLQFCQLLIRKAKTSW
jgi:uncharacterized protein (DUF1778 family)